MPYLISALAAAAGVVVLGAVLVRLTGLVRRLVKTARRSRAYWTERTGLLAVRTAALRAALDRRHHRNEDGSPSAPAA